MYKVFLVDDEIVIREGIRTSFPWEASGFVLAGEAPDGELALSLMQDIKPDILITDIRMPFMDGLELSRRAQASMPWLKTIILSGHDEFTYAREALVLGVKEYLLKPLSAQELEDALRRVAGLIDEERRQYADLQAVKRQLQASSALLREQFMRDVLQGSQEEAKRAGLFPEGRKLGIDIMARHYRVMLVSPVRGCAADPFLPKAVVCRTVDSQPKGSVHFCQMDTYMALLCLNESAQAMEEHAFCMAQAIKHEATDLGLPPLHIAIGSTVGSVFKVPDSLSSALSTLQAMESQPPAQATRIMDTWDEATGVSEAISLSEDASLYDRLRYASQADVTGIVDDFFSAQGDARRSVMMLNYLLVESVMTASRIIREHGGDPEKDLPGGLPAGHGAALVTQADDVARAARKVLGCALAFRDTQSLSRYNEVIRRACEYIDNHAHDPNLTLGDAAQSVHLSPNHFCTVFSQEVGATFIEHLTRLRLERAKELLEGTPLRSSEIAREVGYRDPHYFSYLFRRNTGMSPRDWRKAKQEDAS